MLDVVFYFLLAIGFFLLIVGFKKNESIFIALSAVVFILTGTFLFAGAPIEYNTGGVLLQDVNSTATRVVPELLKLTAQNSLIIWIWAMILFFGGWGVLLIALALSGRTANY